MWQHDAVNEFICDALMWQRSAVSEIIWTSKWLCSRVMRFQSIPTIWPLLTTESTVAQWQSIRLDHGGSWVQIQSGTRIFSESTVSPRIYINSNTHFLITFYGKELTVSCHSNWPVQARALWATCGFSELAACAPPGVGPVTGCWLGGCAQFTDGPVTASCIGLGWGWTLLGVGFLSVCNSTQS